LPDDEVVSIASPLTLLMGEAERETRAHEVLFLSYTLDLGFFERVALGAAQALGARVTVVGDASMVRHDPRAVRRAGRTYLSSLADCSGEFHPKLVAVAGEDRCVVAIGSGNVTLAGWSDNAEIWTVLTAGPDAVPDTISSVAAWIDLLVDHVRIDPLGAAGLSRTAKRLAEFAPTAAGPELVSSLAQPILDQLPVGPVDALEVFAPFHDPHCVALHAVCERLQPSRVSVVVQPDLTVADADSLERVVASVGGDIVIADPARYRHGKLFEWSRDGHRFALTGSPNCSTAALMKTTRLGGNVELGVIDEITASLMPEGTVVAGAQSVTLGHPRPAHRPGVVILGAARVDEGLDVFLARPAPRPGHVELSAPAADPDTWERVGNVTEGASRLRVAFAAEGGSRVRVVLIAPGDDAPIVSNTVFLADPDRALRLPGTFGASRLQAEPFDLFQDWKLAEKFAADLEALRASQLVASAASAKTPASKPPGASTRTRVLTWGDYLDECAGRLGYSLLRFALGLPALAADWSDVELAEWDELIGDDELGLDDDTAEDAANTEAPIKKLPSLADREEYLRKRYRSFAQHLADQTPRGGPADRLLALRLILWIVAADAWKRDDHSWVPVVGAATRALVAEPAPPDDVAVNAASLAAVALAVLRTAAPRTHSTPEGGQFKRAASAVAHLLPAADPHYITQYCELLDQRFGAALSPEVISELAVELVQDDPLEEAIRGLDDHGIEAHIDAGLIHVVNTPGNPELAVLLAVGLAEGASPVAASAGDADDWALMIWRKPDVVVARQSVDRSHVSWTHYRLSDIAGPQTYATTERHLPTDRRVWTSFPGEALNPIVDQLMAAVGLTDPKPPSCMASRG
jgi:hypothetical protein